MSLVRISGSNLAIFALEGAALVFGLGATTIWAVRRGGAGFAAALGLWAPLATLAIYHRAGAQGSFATSTRRDVLEVTSAIWVFVALTATWITIAGLALGRRIARHKVGVLAAVTVVAGVAFTFTNILRRLSRNRR
jgi:hypothetical protein